jgi:hypothetical protein
MYAWQWNALGVGVWHAFKRQSRIVSLQGCLRLEPQN